MAKKETTPTNVNTNINQNTNNITVNVPPTVKKPRSRKAKKPNWVVKAVVLALIGLAVTLIVIYVEGGEKGKTSHIEGGSPATMPDK